MFSPRLAQRLPIFPREKMNTFINGPHTWYVGYFTCVQRPVQRARAFCVWSSMQVAYVGQWRCSDCTKSPALPRMTGIEGQVHDTGCILLAFGACIVSACQSNSIEWLHTAATSPLTCIDDLHAIWAYVSVSGFIDCVLPFLCQH